MSNKVKNIDKTNCMYYFFNDIMNIKNFDLNIIKIDEKLYKNILIYYIEQVMIKDAKYVNINSVSSLYLIFCKMNGNFEKINNDKYLANLNKYLLKK